MKKKENQWRQAKRQANERGITLTKRKNGQGGYVCYLSKKARKNGGPDL